MSEEFVLNKRAEYLNLIMENSKELIWAVDRNNNMLLGNKTFYKVYEQSGGKMGQNNITISTDNFASDTVKFWQESYHRCFQNESFIIETSVDWSDGRHYFENSFSPILQNDEVIGAIVIGHDITARKQIAIELKKAKEQAEERESYINALLQSIDDIVVARNENNEVEYFNKAFEEITLKLFGIQAYKGLKTMDMLQEPAREYWLDRLNQVMQGRKYDEEFEWTYGDGDTRNYEILHLPIYKKDKIIGSLELNRDITYRKQYEKQLLQAKERSEKNEARLIEAQAVAKVGSWEIEIETMRVTWSNEMYKIFEISPSKFSPQYDSILGFVHQDDKERVNAAFMNSLQSVDYNEIEHKAIAHNQMLKYLEHRWRVHTDEYGRNKIVFGTCQDITDKKNAEFELVNARKKAEESDRLKTVFLQNISHEIKTPLNAISGFSGILNRPNISEEKRSSYLSIIQKSSEKLTSIFTDIITLAALETNQETVNLSRVSVNDLTKDLYTSFNIKAKESKLELHLVQGLNESQCEVYTDKNKLNQILSNLLQNAIKFTHIGYIEFGFYLENNDIIFYVKDTGIGIQKEVHLHVFESFMQAGKFVSKQYGGTGLGLSISKILVELLGGRIWVESELMVGTTFFFSIPYKPAGEINTNFTMKKSKDIYILVAEDEEYNYMYLEECLKVFDVICIRATDGLDAIEACQKNPDIMLILMDIKMPIMNGDEAAIKIREFRPQLPIIAQTAYALNFEQAMYKDSFDGYLTKPIREDDLNQIMHKFLLPQRGLN